jgi:TolB-like protein/Tfp pilus assembly protein PilF
MKLSCRSCANVSGVQWYDLKPSAYVKWAMPSRAAPQKGTSPVLHYGLLLLLVTAALGLAVKVQHWRSIVVLPFRNAGGGADHYLADGITEKLIANLGQISAARVISRTSAMSLRQTNGSIPEIARQLGVDGVVDGSVVREGNQLRITAQLSDGNTGRQLWRREYAGQVSFLLELAGDIARDINEQIRTELGPQQQVVAHTAPTTDPAVEDVYLRGQYSLNRSSRPEPYQEALGYFHKAIEKDPSFAPAYAGLAGAYWALGENGLLEYSKAYSQAKLAARKAIELDGNLADGHAVLAETMADFDWDWTGAEAEFRRAIELNPSSSTARFAYAHHLAKMGRAQEAIAEAETGLKLDPISLDAYDNVAFVYWAARQYERGLEAIRQAAGLGLYRASRDNPLHWDLAVLYVEKGDFEKAIDQFQLMADLPHPLGHMGNAYARAGQIEKASQVIAKMRVYVANDGVGTYEIALIYAGLGRKDEAFAWLEKAYQVHDKGLTFLKMDPCVDPLRSDPRFQNLLRRVGLSG